ncbi:ABC transporter ATP-binding protein [Aerococcus sp. UMB10185]|uniref:ABC transporter ATP-binding protein n=1 Tax=unclassified Aerococcus TaxID=2618060 RepID=UPI0008A5A521|nr:MULTISPECIES: ABC transporter ATP-binding protein [unclassified Aerococcus]MDK6232788.1 ABC transporter ATP-binding protein [Aerococcus sp. UMB10185]MDK8501812.1 ABC transporter ATP-binding protein [Aerococcus sp. UMB1112A]OFN02681.1 ABC transporter permease [Aerococcus sp. HMSC062A02]OHO45650.1 ABC transporter permease [Aerococcus sp. HMSC035B07]
MRVIDVLKENKWRALTGFIFKSLEAILELLVPFLMAHIINYGIHPGNLDYIKSRGIFLFILPLCGYLLALVCQWFASLVSQSTGSKLRSLLFDQLNRLDLQQSQSLGSSSIANRMINDTHNIQVCIAMAIRLASRCPVLLVGAMVMSFIVSPQLAPIFILGGLVLGTILSLITLASNRILAGIQKALDYLGQLFAENLSGMRDIRSFASQKREVQRFEEANRDWRKQQVALARVQSLANPASLFVVNLLIALILYFGGGLVNRGAFQQGEVIALVNYMNTILLALNVLVQVLVMISRGVAGIQRVDELLALEPSIVDPVPNHRCPVHLEEPALAVKIDQLSFAYGQKAVLKNINLNLAPGGFYAIVGPTAAGKSTLIHLLERFYKPSSGQIFLNGQDTQEMALTELRQMISLVPQHASLLTGTIRSNLLLGRADATDEELWRALEDAQAAHFVSQLDGGLDAPVSQGGKNFSGGQRQRLTIARALVKEAGLLILDDALSALDFATEARIRSTLAQKSASVLLVSQRLASVLEADQIIVLNYGQVEAVGKHDELLAQSPSYYAMAKSQKLVEGGESLA